MRGALTRVSERNKNLLVLLVATAIALIGADVATRYIFADEIDPELLRARNRRAVIAKFTRASSHPELAYELRPGLDIRWRGIRVVTHPQQSRRIGAGASDRDAPLRIAIIGDSTPFGWRVDFEDTYGEVLRRRLEAHTGDAVEVRNWSVPGYNSHHLRITYRDRVRPFRPQLLIVHYDHNDANPLGRERNGYMEPEYGENPLHSAILKLLLRRRFAARTAGFLQASTDDPNNPEKLYAHYRYAGPQYDRHLAELRGLADLVAADGVKPLVLIFNTWLKRQTAPERDPFFLFLHAPLVEKLQGMGFAVLDTYGPNQALMAERGWDDLSPTWVSQGDGHPNPLGHEFIAGMLYDAMLGRPELASLLRGSP